MSRAPAALLIGLVGFAAYLAVVLALSDFVLRMHWTVQLIYFALAGVVWAWPAMRLIYWSGGK